MEKLRVFEAFSGVGTQRMALRNLGIEHEVVGISEIDKFAIQSYEAIHGPTYNLGDISKIKTEDIPEHDLFTYSFPCQDISLAGRRKGLSKDSGTRSSLLWECNRVIEGVRPKYLLLENVKNLIGKKNRPDFEKWLEHLEDLGYTNYWQVLNAKDYGVPQNRERVFVVSILGNHEPYTFPDKSELTSRLKDVLEENVDESFYLSEEKTSALTFRNIGSDVGRSKNSNVIGNLNKSGYEQADRVYDIEKEAPTISARDYKGPKQILEFPVIAASRGRNPKNPSDRTAGAPTEQRLEINRKGVSNTLTTVQKDNYVLVKNATKKGYVRATEGDGVDLVYPNSKTRPGRVKKETSGTLTTSSAQGVITEDIRIRKLTPLECWRLMGMSDSDFNKAEKVNSNSQLYKQAGNAIVVDVLEAIFSNMFN